MSFAHKSKTRSIVIGGCKSGVSWTIACSMGFPAGEKKPNYKVGTPEHNQPTQPVRFCSAGY
jgi:hypothetical protein